MRAEHVNGSLATAGQNGAWSHIDLTDALLEQVFACVCLVEQDKPGLPVYRPNSAVPQVCQRWNRVYTCSTVIWERLAMDWGMVFDEFLELGPHSLIPRFGYACKWLADRAPYVAHLQYRRCNVLGPGLEQHLFRLCRVACRLRSVLLCDVVRSADSLLAQLGQCATLQEIGIHCQGAMEGPIQQLTVSATALRHLSGLASLRSLTLNVDKVVDNTRDVGDALSHLSQFSWAGRREAVVLHPEFINTLSSLRRLELANCRLGQFTPRTAEVLSHVTFLGVSDVLAAKPRKKAGTTWWDGLRYLEGLRELRLQDQDFAGMPANALACTALRGLTLLRTAAEDWPGPSHLVAQPNCLSGLQSLHLSELRLDQAIHPQFWHSLSSLTKLAWSDIQLLAPDANLMRLLAAHQAMPVPEELSRLQKLEHLCLEYAQLDQVPLCVQVLTNLRRLSLEGNSIQSLPEGHYLTGIEHLNLAANAIHQVPEGLRVCRGLVTLSLARNPELSIGPGDAEALARACPRLQRVQLTECNGLVMGQALEEIELDGPKASELHAAQAKLPGLLVWADDKSEWA